MKAETTNDHISAYERAVCYYTLPKVATSVTDGLVAAYAICVVEALAACIYGLSSGNSTWKIAGATTFVGIVVFGMIVFTIRALVNDWQKRSALAIARNVPDKDETDDIPDPFSSHLLLCRPASPSQEVYACVTIDRAIAYYVQIRREHTHWRAYTSDEQQLLEVLVEHEALRVGIFRTHPVRLGVYSDKKKIAAIVRRNTLRAAFVDVFVLSPVEVTYVIKAGCIYVSDRLVGRIYTLRDNIYLDIEQYHATSGVLAHFMTT